MHCLCRDRNRCTKLKEYRQATSIQHSANDGSPDRSCSRFSLGISWHRRNRPWNAGEAAAHSSGMAEGCTTRTGSRAWSKAPANARLSRRCKRTQQISRRRHPRHTHGCANQSRHRCRPSAISRSSDSFGRGCKSRANSQQDTQCCGSPYCRCRTGCCLRSMPRRLLVSANTTATPTLPHRVRRAIDTTLNASTARPTNDSRLRFPAMNARQNGI